MQQVFPGTRIHHVLNTQKSPSAVFSQVGRHTSVSHMRRSGHVWHSWLTEASTATGFINTLVKNRIRLMIQNFPLALSSLSLALALNLDREVLFETYNATCHVCKHTDSSLFHFWTHFNKSLLDVLDSFPTLRLLKSYMDFVKHNKADLFPPTWFGTVDHKQDALLARTDYHMLSITGHEEEKTKRAADESQMIRRTTGSVTQRARRAISVIWRIHKLFSLLPKEATTDPIIYPSQKNLPQRVGADGICWRVTGLNTQQWVFERKCWAESVGGPGEIISHSNLIWSWSWKLWVFVCVPQHVAEQAAACIQAQEEERRLLWAPLGRDLWRRLRALIAGTPTGRESVGRADKTTTERNLRF